MANVLLLTLVFPPDGVSTAHIMGDLAQDLKAAGHEVVVVTTSPHYNYSQDSAQASFRWLWGGIVSKGDFYGIDVYRIIMPKKNSNLVLRTLSWIWFHVWSTAVAMCLVARPNVLLVPSPPLTMGVSAYLISKRYSAPFIYNVQELYPDIAINLGIIRNRLFIKFLLHVEAFIYAHAHAVTVISQGMKTRLVRKGVVASKVTYIPNFVDLAYFSPADPSTSARSILKDFDTKFIVSYAGNVGPAQNLVALIHAAELLRQKPNIHFVLMGNGSDLASLKHYVTEKQLQNVTFIPYQPLSVVPAFYRRSDLSVVALASDVGNDAVPSKVLRIMACGSAVLALADDRSDLAKFVRQADCGVVVRPESPKTTADIILTLSSSPDFVRQRARNGIEVIKREFSREPITKRYIELVDAIVKSANRRTRATST